MNASLLSCKSQTPLHLCVPRANVRAEVEERGAVSKKPLLVKENCGVRDLALSPGLKGGIQGCYVSTDA